MRHQHFEVLQLIKGCAKGDGLRRRQGRLYLANLLVRSNEDGGDRSKSECN